MLVLVCVCVCVCLHRNEHLGAPVVVNKIRPIVGVVGVCAALLVLFCSRTP